MQNVDCQGFISTGTLDASKLMVDTISGTIPGVGTTIEKTLIEGGGFRVIQVDELEEMYTGQPLRPCAACLRVLTRFVPLRRRPPPGADTAASPPQNRHLGPPQIDVLLPYLLSPRT